MSDNEIDFVSIPSRALQVLTRPAVFFRNMSKTGGFLDPLVFVVVMSIVSGLMVAPRLPVSIGGAAGLMMGVISLVAVTLGAVIGSFILAGVLNLVWLLMGSKENYETAYRCNAFISAISPIAMLLGFVPYLNLIAIAWGLYLVVTASVEVQGLPVKSAWIVFGFFAVIWAMLSVSAQYAVRRMDGYPGDLKRMREQMERLGHGDGNPLPRGGSYQQGRPGPRNG